VKSVTVAGAAGEASGAHYWVRRFIDDLGVIRSANTVRAYEADVQRWVVFCRALCRQSLLCTAENRDQVHPC